ncbi:Hsp70 family protein [Microvirga brassicacearum]|uniref:Hsp70 family protein n=1 Tax=Microvirga brassicacearum TaxID=2580413 RepID=A0A5N3P725_9HYPH|nr:Hsp70 family protein [Microvirga brassicacearum]KAB0265537.1 Hsp70 family protein [Microvirga brassicacearum]
MSSMINFGIDLGTSNSLIAKFDKGQVEVFKNPNGFKESLPSVVAFRNDRILVGDQARIYVEKDPKNVASRFKRKMGTTETIKTQSAGSKTPVELSAFVLKELRNFVHSGEGVRSAVITIPASFDTVQSNATKEAGLAAGFEQVLLLQEPIAASLAYANKERGVDLRNSQWIVYDFGGGTFDVALVRIVEGELTVIDHEGDNYLGGSDLDARVVELILAPQIARRGKFTDLIGQMKSESGKYNKLWYRLLHAAESAKIELSTKSSAEVDLGMVSLEDEEGTVIDSLLTITRSELEEIIKDAVDSTVEMMKVIITRNSLRSEDLKFVLMVGGSTYIPYVRKRVEELMGIAVNTSIDPTNAIAVGAAYFAGAKEFNGGAQAAGSRAGESRIKIRTVFNRNSQEAEETFSAKVEGDLAGLFYRISNEDGSFDSGLKALSARITEDLPLREGAFNFFQFRILDGSNNVLDVGFDSIQIAQGRYSVAGQMLPEDICLVTDDVANKDTRLKKIFSKNGILPTKTKSSVEVGRTITKGSDDDIRIMVVEGPAEKHSSTNKPIGVLQITGKQINRDLMRGTEIDLTFEVSESRDHTVSAYLNGTGQEFSQVFKGTARQVDPRLLASEVLHLENRIQSEAEDATNNGRQDTADKLEKLLGKVHELMSECGSLSNDDVTDDRYKLEDKKRRVAQEVFELTASKRLDTAKAAYASAKQEVAVLVQESGNDRERHQLREVIAREQTFINSTNPERVENATSDLERLRWNILMRLPEFLTGMFENLVQRRASMNDQTLGKQLIDLGERHKSSKSWEDLRQVNGQLIDLMPETERASDGMRLYTGIV